MKADRWSLENLQSRGFEPLVSVLARGGIAILPTDTIYGLHARAADDEAVRRIFAIKDRPEEKSLVVICGSIAQLDGLGVTAERPLLDALGGLWPAPLTAVLPIAVPLPASSGGLTLAIRIPALDWLRAVVNRTGPLVSTSVNASGEAPVISPEQVGAAIGNRVDLIVDGGTLNGQPSTVVDFTESSPRVLREGAFVFTQNLWKTVRKSL